MLSSDEYVYGGRAVAFDFIQWSEVDSEKMLIYFNYIDIHGQKREGSDK